MQSLSNRVNVIVRSLYSLFCFLQPTNENAWKANYAVKRTNSFYIINIAAVSIDNISTRIMSRTVKNI